MREPSVAETVQAVIAGAKPQSAFRVFVYSPDFHLREGAGGRIADEGTGMHVAKAAIGADPQIAAAVFEQNARAEVSEAIPHLVADDVWFGTPRQDMADTFVGGNPHASIPILHHGTNKVVGQAVASGAMGGAGGGDVKDTISIGPDP